MQPLLPPKPLPHLLKKLPQNNPGVSASLRMCNLHTHAGGFMPPVSR